MSGQEATLAGETAAKEAAEAAINRCARAQERARAQEAQLEALQRELESARNEAQQEKAAHALEVDRLEAEKRVLTKLSKMKPVEIESVQQGCANQASVERAVALL